MPLDDTPITSRQKTGIVFFVVSVPVVTDLYWRGFGALPAIGPVPLGVFAAVMALAGALSFCYIGTTRATRVIGLLAGAIAGAGCCLAFHFVYGGVNRAGAERVLVSLAGMAPGLIIGYLLLRWSKRKVA